MLDPQLLPKAPPRLTRSLGVAGVLFLTLSVTSPASSVFVIVPGMLHAAGTGAVWAMAIAALVCVATGFIYAELSSAWPVAGGEYVAVTHTLGPLAGFVMLGINVFNNLLFPPAIALGISALLRGLVPDLPQIPTAMAVIVAATLVALLRIRTNAWITGAFLLVEVAALGAVAWLGAGSPIRAVTEVLLHPVMVSGDVLTPASIGGIGVAATIAIFALNGYGAAVYFGEEMHQAPRRIAWAILLALLITLAIEIVPLVALLVAVPDLGEALTGNDPFGALVRAAAGAGAGDLVEISVVVAIVNAIIACVLASARFFYATGRDNCWGRPIDKWMTLIHPGLHSPWAATVFAGGVGALCCLVPLQFLLVLSGTGLVAIYAGIAAATIVGRVRGVTADAPYRMPLYPLAPIVTLLALAYVGWTSWLDPEEGRPGLIATAAQIILSAAYYWLVLRPRRHWTAALPQEEAMVQQAAE
ncbi:MAG: APC family permease [Sphingomonas sp.]